MATAACLFVFPAGSLFAQLDSSRMMDRISSEPRTVSRNQLLAPAKAVRAIQRAQKDLLGGHLESAQKEIARALAVAPHFALANLMEGAAEMEIKDYDRAAKSFQQAIDDDPALGPGYVGMAVVLIRHGRFQAALPLLDRAEALLPGLWFVHFATAWAQMETGNSDAALKQAESAEQLAGADSEERSGVSYLRAILAVHTNDMDAAREHLAEAVALDPGGPYALLSQEEIGRLQPLSASIR